MTTREIIIKTLGTFAVPFDESTVNMLEGRTRGAVPKGKHFNLPGLAFIVARNWAISKRRGIAVAAKKQAGVLLAADRERREEELRARCRKEFDDIFFKLFPELKCSQPKQIQLVRVICFEGLSSAECARAFPNTTEEQRQKWKVRGLKLIFRYASSELVGFLRRFLNKNAEGWSVAL